MQNQYQEEQTKMTKTIEALKRELATIRAGRANAAILDRVSIEYYGAQTPLAQVASISSPDPRTLVIQPWDMGCLKLIEKEIIAAELGINPQNDGKVIRMCFPPLTEERRKEFIKQVKKIAEESKVTIRNVRRDALEVYKNQKKKSEITEDDYKVIEDDMQELTEKFSKEIDAIAEKKEKELMEL